jgi:hypothetical protein
MSISISPATFHPTNPLQLRPTTPHPSHNIQVTHPCLYRLCGVNNSISSRARDLNELLSIAIETNGAGGESEMDAGEKGEVLICT